jgi:hypothetical protein
MTAPLSDHFRQVPIKPFIGHGDQTPIEPLLIRSALVSSHKQDCPPARIKRKSDSPNFACPSKPEFLHVRVSRTFQGIDSRTTKIRPELPQQQRMGKQFVLEALFEGLELGVELALEQHLPSHGHIMPFASYGIKTIWH